MRGAREHNLKDVDVAFPRDRLVVITGLSGTGKSSLAFDTIYAEGQRRYVESLSAYARQFLGQMEKPDVDQIDGLSPAISIDQKGASRNPRSTVGTVTEIYDHLRLLFARIGIPHCPNGHAIERQTVQQIVDQVLALPEGTRLLVLGPLIKDRKTEGDRVFDGARRQGFVRVRVDGEMVDIADAPKLDKYKRHSIEVVVDRYVVRHAEAPEGASARADGRPIDPETGVAIPDPGRRPPGRLDRDRAAARRGRRAHRPGAARRRGARLRGAPLQREVQLPVRRLHGRRARAAQLLVQLAARRLPRLHRPRDQARDRPGPRHPGPLEEPRDRRARAVGADADRRVVAAEDPRGDLRRARLGLPTRRSATCRPRRSTTSSTRKKDEKVVVRYRHERGENTYKATFEGVVTNLERRYRETDSDYIKTELEKFMVTRPCPTCGGKRLRPEILAVTIGDAQHLGRLDDVDHRRARAGRPRSTATLTERERTIAYQLLKEIVARLGFLVDVGLDYLTLDRTSVTLSGGEAQRIRLATQIGTTLMGVLYILDEPSIGLHQRDNAKLIATLTRLRDLGNTVLVVEHDEETIRTADWVVDIGPGAGEHGGEIIANGPLEAVLAEPRSITGAFLRGERAVPIPAKRRKGNGKALRRPRRARAQPPRRRPARPARDVRGGDRRVGQRQEHARHGGPLPGAGPRAQRLARAGRRARRARGRRARRQDHRDRPEPDRPDAAVQPGDLRRAVHADPRAVRRRPGVARPRLHARAASASTSRAAAARTARATGSSRSRCSSCPDVYVPCEVCHGKRYNREALEIHFKGKSIADVLEMTIAEALDFFSAVPNVTAKLQTLNDVGLGYVHLGQPATTLSGGEAQRVKLSTELSRRATGRTLYVLDEPTTGLHFADVEKLLEVLHRLVDGGNTVLVIEHNLDVIKTADWIVDLGPEGGDRGGRIIAEGTPEKVADRPRLGDRRVPRPGPARRAARAAVGRDVRRGGRRGDAATATDGGPRSPSRRAGSARRRARSG